MVDKTPAQITPGNANRGSVVHASDASLADLSRSHSEEDISRLQSAVIAYNPTITYDIGDFTLESDEVYRCITAITVPEVFTVAKWELVPIPQTPWESDIDAAGFNLLNFGYLESNAAIPADAGTIRFGNTEGLVWRNAGNTGNLALFADSDDNLSTNIPINSLGGDLIFKRVNFEGLRLTTNGISVTGQADIDTFVNLTEIVTPDNPVANDGRLYTKDVSAITHLMFLDSAGTETDLNLGNASPLTTKGDIYTYDTADARLPVGANGQVLTANSAVALGVEWAAAGGGAQTPWTSDIDADAFNLLDSGYLEQNEISEPADPAAGLLRLWSESDAGFSVLRYKGNNGFVNTISQDVFIPVRNITGVTLLKGKVVYVTGAQGQRVTVDLARADADSTMRGIGFLLDDVANNSNGYVIVAGTERDINTNAFTAGDRLYVSETTAGEVTTTPPTHPDISQVIGFVLVSNPTTGEINVIPGDTNGQEEGTNKNTYLIGDSLTGTKTLGFVDDTGTQTITTDANGINVNVKTAGNLEILVGATVRVTADDDDVSVTDLNLIMDGGYAEVSEIVEPATPAADKARFWLDAAVIINDHPRLVLKDENGVNFDLSSAGMVVNTYNTEAIGGNHYLALSGLNTSNLNFVNRAVVLPRAARFYNMYITVTTNGTSIVTNCALNDADASPTILDVDIPIGTTGTFTNTDDFVDLAAGVQVAYGFGLTTGGTLAIASVGMAMDQLRLEI